MYGFRCTISKKDSKSFLREESYPSDREVASIGEPTAEAA